MRWIAVAMTLELFAVVLPCHAEDGNAPTPAEAEFAALMSGATLAGFFTLDREGDGPPELHQERYTLGEVKKLPTGMWLFNTRIQYMEHDVTLPIVLPVVWADDTAVIRVDKIGFPGLGTYSARVLIHDGKYAGYWQGAGYGGRLFGTIERTEGEPVTEPPTPPQ